MKRKKIMLSTLIGASLVGSLNMQAFALDNKDKVQTEISASDVEMEVSTSDVEMEVSTSDAETEVSTSDVETEVSTSDVETEVSTSDVETEVSTDIDKGGENVGVSEISENTHIMGPSDRTFSSITLDSWVPTPGPNSTGYYQKFTRTGFQPYIYRGVMLYNYHGFVKSFSDTKFELLTNFFTINGKLYYSDQFGRSRTGLNIIDGKYYFFNQDLSDPYAIKGWKNIGGYIYYFDSDYQAVTGPKLIDGKVYFFNEVGFLVKGLVEEAGRTYYFDPKTGQQITGWQSLNNNQDRYFFDPLNGGAAHEGWFYGNSKGKMYFDDRGKMAKGRTKIGDDYYLFEIPRRDSNAYLKTGWYYENGKTYYFDSRDGGRAARNDIRRIDGHWYRFDNDGALVH